MFFQLILITTCWASCNFSSPQVIGNIEVLNLLVYVFSSVVIEEVFWKQVKAKTYVSIGPCCSEFLRYLLALTTDGLISLS